MVSISQIRNVANYATKYTEVLGKTSILQTKALENVNFTGLKFAPSIASVKEDTFSCAKKLIPADNSLFSWAKRKPEFSISNINPDSVALVHMTNYYPKDGKILSTNLATKDANGVGESRTTIHFCLNKSVTEHFAGNPWNTMDYAIILPFKDVLKETPKSKILGGLNEDFFFQDLVKLPKGSVIIKHNPNIPEGKFLTSDAFDGIKLVETSNKELNKSADIVLQKMGYTTYNDALKNYLGVTEAEIEKLTNMPESALLEQLDLIKKQGGINIARNTRKESWEVTKEMFGNDAQYAELLETNYAAYKDTMAYYNLLEKHWDKLEHLRDGSKKFCNKENLFNGLHTQSPWFKAEYGISALEMAKIINNNSWGKSLKDSVINILNQAKNDLPKGKSLGFDIDKAINIVKGSKTPLDAEKILAQELKIKPMQCKDTTFISEIHGENAAKGFIDAWIS